MQKDKEYIGMGKKSKKVQNTSKNNEVVKRKNYKKLKDLSKKELKERLDNIRNIRRVSNRRVNIRR